MIQYPKILEKHHMIPISLYGPDVLSNIMEIEKRMHILLHDILNIPPSQYSKWTRDFKKQTNGKKIRTPADIDMIYDIQCAFFYNLDKLPKPLQQQHLIKMREYMQRELMEALKVGVEFYDNNNANLNFNGLHEKAFLIKKETHRKIIDDLRKIYLQQ